MLFFTKVSLAVISPIVSTTYSYEGSNPASPVMPLGVVDAIPEYIVSRTSKLKLTLVGNINWDGCSVTSFINFQPLLRYSLDGGTTYNQYGTSGVAVHNGGTDFVLPLVLHVSEGQRLRVQPAIRFQQDPNWSTNCMTGLSTVGSFELME